MNQVIRHAGWLASAASAIVIGVSARGQQPPADNGRSLFEARCASCHGADGLGSSRGPAIVDQRQPKAATRAAVRELIRRGSPDAGMPPFALADTELDALAGYVELMRAPAADHPTDGDIAAGEQFFKGKGNCVSCHMVGGQGGVLGPDLTNLARERKLPQIERALRQPGTAPAAAAPAGRGGAAAPTFRAVTVRMRDNRTIRGLVRYESLFDLGVQGLDGIFYSISKSQVTDLKPEASLMPPVQASAREFQDLVAYLTRLTNDRAPARPSGRGASGLPTQQTVGRGGIAFTDVLKPKTGEWPSYNGQMSGNRHSLLADINTNNVARLAPAWMFPVPGNQRTLQVTPIVTGGVMYVTAVNEAWALDARTGRQIWHYGRPRTQGLVGDPASGINRGVAVLGDRVFLQTDNAHLIALHRLSGQQLWDVEMADSRQHYGSTGAPLIVNDLVIAGVSGGDEGMRGFLDAYRADTGERAWRFWTVPAPGERGSETWVGRAWEHGCAGTWLPGTYDPEARLLYWATGNPCPDYNGDERQGDNLYSDSVIALDPATGTLKWHYQFTPHDLYDWDSAETPVLVDAMFQGRPRKLLLHGDRNGFFYVLDRLTGEFLLGEKFVKSVTWASGIGKDGRPIRVAGTEPAPQGMRVCPAQTGATNWPSTAFSPSTGFFYLMAQEGCSIYTKNSQWWIQGQSFYGGSFRRSADDPAPKFLRAIDIQTGKIAWEIPDLAGGVIASGVLSTAGGLVFFGDSNGGAFVAADARTGKLLWHFDTGQGWKSGPMTYAINGKQYIGVAAGATIMTFALP